MLDIIRVRAQSWGVKIIFGIIILVFIFWGVGNMGSTPANVVASVNGQDITAQEFYKEAQAQMNSLKRSIPDIASNPERLEQLKSGVVNLLVTSALKQQEAQRLGIVVTPHELGEVIGKIGLFQDASGKFNNAQYLAQLKAQKISQGEFQEGYTKQILEEKLQGHVALSVDVTEEEARNFYNFRLEKYKAEYVLFPVADYKAKATPTDDEIKNYYNSHQSEFAQPARISLDFIMLTPKNLAAAYMPSRAEIVSFFEKNKDKLAKPLQYDSRHILLRCPPDGSTESGAAALISSARTKADGIAAQLKKGADFAELARSASEDPGTAPDGGALGWIQKGVMVLEFEAAALAMKKGEISAPIRTQFGFHIIKLDDSVDAQPAVLEKLETEIAVILGEDRAKTDFEKVQGKVEEYLRTGKPLADIAKEFKIPLESTGVIEQTQVQETLSLQQGGTEILKNVPVGKVAPSPLEIKEGIALVQVKDRLAAAPTPFEEARAQIVTNLTETKAQELARAAAQEALASVTGANPPATMNIKESEPFIRMLPRIEPLGNIPALVEALCSAPEKKWLPVAYATPAGGVIARVSSITPPSDEEWATQKTAFISRFLQRKREDVVTAFMQNLLASAKVTVQPNLLKQIQLR